MNRGYLINYLIENDCYPDEEYDVPEVSQLWHNAINGHMCYIPYEEDLAVTTYCIVFFELKVEPPREHGYDSDYAVFISFRQQEIAPEIPVRKEKEDN